MHFLLSFKQELNATSNYSYFQACNVTFMVEKYLFSCSLCVCCFVVCLGLCLGGCTICACYRTVSKQHIIVSS